MISRRDLLVYSLLISISSPFFSRAVSEASEGSDDNGIYPQTVRILKEAYWSELIASKHYDGYCQKALSDNYPNIAYLFYTFSISENIHAANYQKLILSLGSNIKKKEILLSIDSTKSNLNKAATNELKKINEFYPKIIQNLSTESHDQAVMNCMYSWKSHQQHEEIIKDIKKYSGLFFKSLAKEIEKRSPTYFVCDICGSTIDDPPELPCEICNKPLYHYKKIERPLPFSG
jgi:rubrerythrin